MPIALHCIIIYSPFDIICLINTRLKHLINNWHCMSHFRLLYPLFHTQLLVTILLVTVFLITCAALVTHDQQYSDMIKKPQVHFRLLQSQRDKLLDNENFCGVICGYDRVRPIVLVKIGGRVAVVIAFDTARLIVSYFLYSQTSKQLIGVVEWNRW